MLPAITDANPEIYISVTEIEATSWTVFINPFSYNLWIVLACVAMVMAFVFTTTERYFGVRDQGKACQNLLVDEAL